MYIYIHILPVVTYYTDILILLLIIASFPGTPLPPISRIDLLLTARWNGGEGAGGELVTSYYYAISGSHDIW